MYIKQLHWYCPLFSICYFMHCILLSPLCSVIVCLLLLFVRCCLVLCFILYYCFMYDKCYIHAGGFLKCWIKLNWTELNWTWTEHTTWESQASLWGNTSINISENGCELDSVSSICGALKDNKSCVDTSTYLQVYASH